MSTDSFNKLDPPTQKWYKERLEVTDPYSTPYCGFSVKIGDFPSICYLHTFILCLALAHFLLMTWGLMSASKLTIRLLKAGSEMWHSTRRCIRPLSFFIPPFLIAPLSSETCNPPSSPCLSWHQSPENTRFYDDTPESGRLKKII